MSVNNYRIQIANAVAPIERVATRKGTTFEADILTEKRERRKAFLKLLKVEDIAREILCATLARKLHLPIKQAFYVNVDPSIVEGRLQGNTFNVAFGIERDYFPSFHLANNQLEEEILNWSDALRCAVFDEWIFNPDRLPKNLMFVKNGEYWLIDHDEALPNSAKDDESANSSILQLLSKGKSELELHSIRRSAMNFVDEYNNIDWSEIHNLVRPEELQQSDASFQKYIEFLKNRTLHMHMIITKSLGIRQQELKFSDRENRSEENNK